MAMFENWRIRSKGLLFLADKSNIELENLPIEIQEFKEEVHLELCPMKNIQLRKLQGVRN